MKTVLPDSNSEEAKREQVGKMFDDISPKYDLLNRLLSMGIDVLWRKKVVRNLANEKPERILDIATGTGDLAIELINTGAHHVTGIDISEGMLKVGKEKVIKRSLENKILLQYGDALNIQYPSDTFDAITIAFGIRNFEDPSAGLKEMYRVLKPGGSVNILEFSIPRNFIFRNLYFFYFRNVLPLIGKLISKNSKAYVYLPESVQAFPYGEKFTSLLRDQNFKQIRWQPLTFGIASLYTGRK